MYEHIRDFVLSGFLNVAGGCCGTNPGHIAAIARACEGVKPREPRPSFPYMRLSGLEALSFTPERVRRVICVTFDVGSSTSCDKSHVHICVVFGLLELH